VGETTIENRTIWGKVTTAREAGETTIETAIFRTVTTAREAGETTIENRTIWGKVTTAREAGETEIEITN
jgi:hypothetical protein